jgi:hypothetical protein
MGRTTLVSFPEAAADFLFSLTLRPSLGPNKPSHKWVPVSLSPEREADVLPPSITEVKNGGVIPPLRHMFYGVPLN